MRCDQSGYLYSLKSNKHKNNNPISFLQDTNPLTHLVVTSDGTRGQPLMNFLTRLLSIDELLGEREQINP